MMIRLIAVDGRFGVVVVWVMATVLASSRLLLLVLTLPSVRFCHPPSAEVPSINIAFGMPDFVVVFAGNFTEGVPWDVVIVVGIIGASVVEFFNPGVLLAAGKLFPNKRLLAKFEGVAKSIKLPLFRPDELELFFENFAETLPELMGSVFVDTSILFGNSLEVINPTGLPCEATLSSAMVTGGLVKLVGLCKLSGELI